MYKRTKKFLRLHYQFLAAILANLSSISAGSALAWTSPVLIKLSDPALKDSPLNEVISTSSDESGWISSILAIGALSSPYVAGFLADKIGRKRTLLISGGFFIIAFLILIFTNQLWMIYLARFIQGCGVGFTVPVVAIYCGEISSNNSRGAIGSFLQLFMTIGFLYVYIIGPYVSYANLQIACLAVSIFFVITFSFMPDTPYYYVQKGLINEATLSLKRLRGTSFCKNQLNLNSLSIEEVDSHRKEISLEKIETDLSDEMRSIQGSVEEALNNAGSTIDIFRNKGNLKALLICCGLIIFDQLSGINAILFNCETIFAEAKTNLSSAISTIIIGLVQTIASSITPFLSDKTGRKPLLLSATILMSVTLLILGVYFSLKSSGYDITQLQWLALPVLIIYIGVYCTAWGAVVWSLLGEMFSSNIKSPATSFVVSVSWILGFIVTKWYPNLNYLGIEYSFWLFSGFCAIAFFFVFYIVIETKGLSLQEIQHKLNS